MKTSHIVLFALCIAVIPNTYGKTHQEHNNDLIAAVKNNDLEGVSEALENGADINTNAMPAKEKKEFEDGIEFSKKRLKKKNPYADVILQSNGSIKDIKLKATPLHIASFEGYTKIVKFLLQNGAQVDSLNIFGQTPLQMAIEGNTKNGNDCIKTLLEAGAKPNHIDKAGDRPIPMACVVGNKIGLQYLLEMGGKPDLVSKLQPKTALMCTIEALERSKSQQGITQTQIEEVEKTYLPIIEQLLCAGACTKKAFSVYTNQNLKRITTYAIWSITQVQDHKLIALMLAYEPEKNIKLLNTKECPQEVKNACPAVIDEIKKDGYTTPKAQDDLLAYCAEHDLFDLINKLLKKGYQLGKATKKEIAQWDKATINTFIDTYYMPYIFNKSYLDKEIKNKKNSKKTAYTQTKKILYDFLKNGHSSEPEATYIKQFFDILNNKKAVYPDTEIDKKVSSNGFILNIEKLSSEKHPANIFEYQNKIWYDKNYEPVIQHSPRELYMRKHNARLFSEEKTNDSHYIKKNHKDMSEKEEKEFSDVEIIFNK